MCLGVVLALVLLPLFGGAVGYANFGATGAWAGGVGGILVGLAISLGPFALLANAERCKLARERLAHPEDRVD